MDISISISINNALNLSSGITPPLDDYTGAQTAYSIARKLRTAYTGDAIRVRESSGDAELNIGFDANGDLDETALLAHCGSNSGYVVTAYDQSGNGNDWTQATANKQPRIVNAGTVDKVNGKPAIYSDGTDDNLSLTIAGVANTTAFHVYKQSRALTMVNSGGASYRYGYAVSADAAASSSNSGTPTFYINNSSIGTTKGDLYTATYNVHVVTSVINLDLSHPNWSKYDTGHPSSSVIDAPEYIQETIIYDSDKSSDRTSIETNINDYYSVYTPLLLDLYPDAQTAYSIARKLKAGYTGDAIRVRRSSDNLELDIGFDSNGDLDESALTTHTGANDGFIVTAYDQSGNANDWTQATANLQPRIVSSGVVDKVNSKPCIVSDVDDVIVSTVAGADPSSVYIIGKTTANITTLMSSLGNNGDYGHSISGDTNLFTYNANSDDPYVNGTQIGNKRGDVYTAIYNSQCIFSSDNVDLLHISWSGFKTNKSSASFYPMTNIQETIIYDSDKSSDRAAIETNINDYYTIY